MDRCSGECCLFSFCLNGGKCEERCDPEKPRFKCVCQPGTTGKYCEVVLPKPKAAPTLTGCGHAWQAGNKNSGQYEFKNATNQTIRLFCDMDSEPDFIWTLILSYSLKKSSNFNSKGMGVNCPINEENMNWENYRLSLKTMELIANSSTHFRATCNFPVDGLVYTDYARAKLDGLDIFREWGATCRSYEFANIRDISCVNCTAGTRQKQSEMFHINSFRSRKSWGCDFDGRLNSVQWERNFGNYRSDGINPAHRCSASTESTTQFWFGQKRLGN